MAGLTLAQALERAVAAYKTENFVAAETLCRQIIAASPVCFEALHLLAVIQASVGKNDLAVANYDRALAVRPDAVQAHFNRGVALHASKRHQEALASYDRALGLRPEHADALVNRGVALYELQRYEEALTSYDRALILRPAHAGALNNRGNTLQKLGRLDEALASYDRAQVSGPDDPDVLNNRGNVLRQLDRLDEALASYERALAAKADHRHALSGAADCAGKLCDWERRARFAADLVAHVLGKKSVISPLILLVYSGDLALQSQCASNYIANEIPSPPRPFWTGETWRRDRLRIAYLSTDFRAHPVAHLTAGLFEEHDRSRFEVLGISLGSDDRSEIRKRIIAAFDVFHDVRGMSDREVARLLYDHQVDIAIDLMGYTRDSRPGILACRPVPIQASYMGFPATMAADFIDYIIADKVVAPFAEQRFYKERIVHLPECYWVTDRKLKIAERTPTRAEAALPEQGFVFCCFNNSWKIAPEIFDVWMRLLREIEGSVLWLLRDNAGAERNLRKEAQRRGIDPSRLVIAARLPYEEHLARHRLADLFLDTLPYNAHTTASDALWTGVPVLTCEGEAFAGRVAASLLQAIGVPELITATLCEYEALALRLARDRARLAEIKAKLARHRDTHPLFDTARFARHMESAYTKMWEIWQRGEGPRGFSVEPLGGPVLTR